MTEDELRQREIALSVAAHQRYSRDFEEWPTEELCLEADRAAKLMSSMHIGDALRLFTEMARRLRMSGESPRTA